MREVGSAWEGQGVDVGSSEGKGVRILCFQNLCLNDWSRVVPIIGVGRTQRGRHGFNDKSYVDPASSLGR